MTILRTAPLLAALFLFTGCGGGSETAAPPAPPAGVTPFAELDFKALPSDYKEAMKVVRASQQWSLHEKHRVDGADAKADPRKALELKMNRDLLEKSYEAGCGFLVKWQLPEGNFRYMYDWMEGTWVEDDHQVRQAGSLWGVSTCYRYRPSPEAKAALDKGLKFWFDATVAGPEEGTLTLKYRDEDDVHSGTVALVALSIVEYLKADAELDPAYKTELEGKLDGYLKFIRSLQMKNGHISDRWYHSRGKGRNRHSPYYDGESLLAMTKAARELDLKWLVPTIEKAAPAMAKTYTVDSWDDDRDSKETKGFFQWGSMAFVEYTLAKWNDYELFGDVALSLGWWMTHTHSTLKRRRNHAYAIEGLISAWRIANMRGDVPAQTDLLYTLDRSLYKLNQWQIGGPLAGENKFLTKENPQDPMTMGGVMNAARPSGAPVKKDVSHQLRIDVTQHQMHATTLALEEVYVLDE